jgi:small subunit ribosomal protein S7
MSRRNAAPKRVILPDPVYNDLLMAKFVNCIMEDGKKSKAERIVYTALEDAFDKLKKIKIDEDDTSAGGESDSDSGSGGSAVRFGSVLDVLNRALANVRPVVEVKSRRVGGSTYQVPVEVADGRAMALAMRWVKEAARKRSGQSMVKSLSSELVEACQKRGTAVKKRTDVHKMAEANRAFVHFRW